MRNDKQIVVLKFGSSVLRSDEDLPVAVQEIQHWRRRGKSVVAVVSAFGNTTDELTRRARRVSDQPNDRLFAALLATGEATASALLGLALDRAGVETTVLDVVQADLRTVGRPLDAELVKVDIGRLTDSLQKSVVVLPGFVGRDQNDETTLLGRGGSDLTALFLAHRLGADCRLIKDVDGLYTCDPNSATGRTPERYERVSYQSALRVGGVVVQPKAIEFAQSRRLRFAISSIASNVATEVGPFQDYIAGTQLLETVEECAA